MEEARIVFVDIRNKLVNENVISDIIFESDVVIPLTPYTVYVLEKNNINYTSLSDFKSNKDFVFDVISDYQTISDSFTKLNINKYQFLIRDIGKYVTFEHYLRIIESIKRDRHSIYITNVDDPNGLGKNTPLSNFTNFTSEIKLNSDEKFYQKNRAKILISKIKRNNIFKLLGKVFIRKGKYLYDNASNIFDYKKIVIGLNSNAISKFDFEKIIETLRFINFNHNLEKILNDEIGSLFVRHDKFSVYEPFVFLNGESMYSRYLAYIENKIPTFFMQHGSNVNEDYFLKHNEIFPADVNLVFNEYTKELFESRGAKEVYCVGTNLYNNELISKKKKFDYVYITYCTKYSYSGFHVGSEHDIISPVSENIYNRHKDVIELFGRHFPNKKICIKMQPGVFTGQQLYIPLIEHANNFPNIEVVFDEPLHNLIEESLFIISDYFSSEFSNRNILKSKNIIMFTDMLKLSDEVVRNDLDKLLFLVDEFEHLKKIIEDFDLGIQRTNPNDLESIINRYSSAGLDTKNEVYKLIKSKLDSYH
ncbi:hypothetical protein TW78_02550 [Vibrio coralliilyticus]|uniref:Uncharacterized protein n=1 Tax=Vibrio coralliilyticus TaxID=190893 RepID=A0A837G238_9VIBR|nr:hypothetical protein [Vibrio coralliilyticus]KJY78452.1 hypothetical protein TW78_02550 [Vibrio coralliilyticus]QOU29779.1 hypothetical protein TW71_014620 [Vibrio coralliilyticus]